MIQALIEQLEAEHILPFEDLVKLLTEADDSDRTLLFKKARSVTDRYYGHDIYTRGLIEFTNYCKNDCLYCGIRKSNRHVERYRLSEDDILACCREGHRLGFSTFVLQGGEDPFYTRERMCHIVSAIREHFPECAITLSIGEKSYDDYLAYYKAGANRYLLRHETADELHYAKLHPPELSLKNRMRCLYDLKTIGYQTGTGFMVGSPGQTPQTLAKDLLFIHKLQPEMIGIGPFIAHHDTPFKDCANGTLDMTVFLIAVLRLIRPNALIPATTALGTIHPDGRKMGVLAGANVVMPNLSPLNVRHQYTLYDNKIYMDAEAAESRGRLKEEMASIGYRVTDARGDMKPLQAASNASEGGNYES